MEEEKFPFRVETDAALQKKSFWIQLILNFM